MNDNDLREMFRRREVDVRAPLGSPPSLARRTRRRQLLTVGGGAAIALVVVLGSIAGLRSLGSSEASLPGDVEQATTKTISGITITYPGRWFAEDPVAIGIEPNDVPRMLPTLVLALTRDDPRIEGVLGCPGLASVPAGQVLMTVQEIPLALSGEASTSWPVSLLTMDVGTSEPGGCYGGWTLMRASWTAAGRSFEARLGFASDASNADRSALTDAYSSMAFAPGSVAAGETVTIGSGTALGGEMWSLTATLDPSGISWIIQTDNGGFGSSAARIPQTPLVEVYGSSSDGAFAVAVLPGDVRSVELETGGRVIGDIRPFSVMDGWGSVRFAVIPLQGNGSGQVRFLDLDGASVYQPETISWGTGQI